MPTDETEFEDEFDPSGWDWQRSVENLVVGICGFVIGLCIGMLVGAAIFGT